MKKIINELSLLVLFWLSVLLPTSVLGDDLNDPNVSYVIGGEPAIVGSQPWLVSLQIHGQHFCGGSLVAPNWVLTAAHCLGDQNKNVSIKSLNIKVGATDLSDPSQGVYVKASAAFSLKWWKGEGDIALIKLKKPILDQDIPYLLLANQYIMRVSGYEGAMATVSGWGMTDEKNYRLPSLLQTANLPIASWQSCAIFNRDDVNLSRHEICAGYTDGGKDACYGDSGGPLVVWDDGHPVQVGIVSWGRGCGHADKYGIYTKVASFYKRIYKTMRDNSNERPVWRP